MKSKGIPKQKADLITIRSAFSLIYQMTFFSFASFSQSGNSLSRRSYSSLSEMASTSLMWKKFALSI